MHRSIHHTPARRPRRRAGACPTGPPAARADLAVAILEHGHSYVLESGDIGCRWGQLHVCLTRLGHLYLLTPTGIATLWDAAPGLPPVIRELAFQLVTHD